MDDSLLSIKGISAKMAKKLAEQGIDTITDLLQKAATPEERDKLSQTIKVDKIYITLWVKQADLMRIDGLGAVDADLMIKLGIRNVKDLAGANLTNLAKMLTIYNTNYPKAQKRTAAVEELERWKTIAGSLESKLINDPDDETLDYLMEKPHEESYTSDTVIPAQSDYIETQDVFFDDMTEIIVNLGKGIAEAQHVLDMNAIQTQEAINDDPEIRATGLMATWYAIPEAVFNLKMNYAVALEQNSSGETTSDKAAAPVKKILMSPINAKYQNYFKLNESTQSELNLKFVPVPPPSAISQVLFAPDLGGQTLDEAKKTITEANLVLNTVTVIEGIPAEGKDTQVVEQSILAGAEIRFNDKIDLKIYKKPEVVIS
jgi:predicted flap endonuclease-1-like 5' DNA nuclease